MSCNTENENLCNVEVNQCPTTRPEARKNWWILEQIRKVYCTDREGIKTCCPATKILELWNGTQTELIIPVPPEGCEVNKDSIQLFANGSVQYEGLNEYGYDCVLNPDNSVTITTTENWGEVGDECKILVYYSLDCLI